VADVVNARVETPIVVATWVPMLPTAYVASTATIANPRMTTLLAVARTFLIEFTSAIFTLSSTPKLNLVTFHERVNPIKYMGIEGTCTLPASC